MAVVLRLAVGQTFKVWVWQLGDIFFVATPGEPYTELQTIIRQRCPGTPVADPHCFPDSQLPTYSCRPNHQMVTRQDGGAALTKDVASRGRCCAAAGKHVVVSVNTNGSLTQGYILPASLCGCGCYQDKIAVVGPGASCLVVHAANTDCSSAHRL